ncbi:MAG: hypothetical protein EAZ76_02150 [Nostocales cyanobacterium]|nr:MAG: hypothetical protein EAZ87_04690 [Nostocales cyanobacterium]TAF20192.1 MAG: hypothetical protein EAZ76_02150 [Nostocales cyanobacterium]
MFLCKIELVSLLSQEQTPATWLIGEYNFDPGIYEGDDILLVWDVDKVRRLKVKVISRQKEIYPKGSHTGHQDKYVLLLRIIAEAEDRDELIQVANYMKQTFPGKFDEHNPSLIV